MQVFVSEWHLILSDVVWVTASASHPPRYRLLGPCVGAMKCARKSEDDETQTLPLIRRRLVSGVTHWQTPACSHRSSHVEHIKIHTVLICSTVLCCDTKRVLRSPLERQSLADSLSMHSHIYVRPMSCTASTYIILLANVVVGSSVCLSSVVCNVSATAPYSGDWNFWKRFYAIWYLGHLWPFGKNFTEIVPGPSINQSINQEIFNVAKIAISHY